MPKSWFIFIADSAGTSIEFKIIFKEDETKVDMMSCSLKKKVVESELLKILLNPKELIEKKNVISKKEALKSLGVVDSDDSDDDKE